MVPKTKKIWMDGKFVDWEAAQIHVLSHTPPDQSNFASQEGQIREELLTQKRSLAYEIYRQNLKKELIASGKLKMNEEGMKTFLASYETQ